MLHHVANQNSDKIIETMKQQIVYQKLKQFMDLENLPEDLHISTITITCKLDTDIYIHNVGQYIDLSPNGIISVKYDNGSNYIRSLIPKKLPKIRKKKKQPKKIFYNQVSIEVRSKTTKNKVNVKLFKNGSIHMTGCKSINNCIEILTLICKELKKVKAIVDPKTMDRIIIKPFVTKIENVDVTKIKKFLIRMINSNFNIGFRIDRNKLYSIMLTEGISCTFEPCAHAGVNIKYNYKGIEPISIFIFESGSIIITGAKHRDHIISAYNFITKKLYENYQNIVLNNVNVENLLNRPDIQKMLMSTEN